MYRAVCTVYEVCPGWWPDRGGPEPAGAGPAGGRGEVRAEDPGAAGRGAAAGLGAVGAAVAPDLGGRRRARPGLEGQAARYRLDGGQLAELDRLRDEDGEGRLGGPALDPGPRPGPDRGPVPGPVHGSGHLVPAAAARLVMPARRPPPRRARRRRGRGVEEGDLARRKRTAAALGAWIVFEDETGQSMRPPRSRTWGRRGITPVIRVRGAGSASLPVAGLACCRPGFRARLLYRVHQYRGRKGEKKAFAWTGYRDMLVAAHHQLPGGNVVPVWDNPNVHTSADMRAWAGAQPWLRVFQLPSYAPGLNPVEGIWSSLKRGPLANIALTGPAHLLQVLKTGLKRIQYRPGLINACLAETGLHLEECKADIIN